MSLEHMQTDEPAAASRMRDPVRTPRVASRRLTSASMTAGVVLSALCFLVAVAAEVAGADTDPSRPGDLAALAEGLAAVAPWAWASLGTYILVVAPAISLVVTAAEYAHVGDRGTVGLALAVLGVLALSAVVALLR